MTNACGESGSLEVELDSAASVLMMVAARLVSAGASDAVLELDDSRAGAGAGSVVAGSVVAAVELVEAAFLPCAVVGRSVQQRE